MCPGRQPSPIKAKHFYILILTLPHSEGLVMSLKSEVWATRRWTYSPNLETICLSKFKILHSIYNLSGADLKTNRWRIQLLDAPGDLSRRETSWMTCLTFRRSFPPGGPFTQREIMNDLSYLQKVFAKHIIPDLSFYLPVHQVSLNDRIYNYSVYWVQEFKMNIIYGLYTILWFIVSPAKHSGT